MCQRSLSGVLGEHCDAVFRAETAGTVRGEQQVGAPVERLVDLRPGEFAVSVDEREPRRVCGSALLGKTGHQGPIGRLVDGRSKDPCRNLSTSMGMASATS